MMARIQVIGNESERSSSSSSAACSALAIGLGGAISSFCCVLTTKNHLNLFQVIIGMRINAILISTKVHTFHSPTYIEKE